MIKIAIVGFSGRQRVCEASEWPFYINLVETEIEEMGLPWNDIILVSGGAAWIDHIAVTLALKWECSLVLCLPAAYDAETGRIDCALANKLHEDFGKLIGTDTFEDMKMVKCERRIGNGFLDRNKMICDIADIMIGVGDVKLGGLRDVWGKFGKKKLKINITASLNK